MKRDLTKGIIQISEALGLLERFPIDLGPRIEALFLYRNKMFHHGLEWPLRERTAFERKIRSWPAEWFSKEELVPDPWLFLLSEKYISDTVIMIEAVLDDLGSFVFERREPLDEARRKRTVVEKRG